MKRFIILMLMLIVLSASVEAALVVNKYTNDFTLSSQYNEQIKLCGCETKIDTILIENVGNFHANYHVEIISPVDEWMTLTEQDFSLAPKHGKELLNYIQAPCGEIGTFDYALKVTSSYGRTEYLSRTVRSDTCENLVLSIEPQEQTSNLCTETAFDITLKNVGTYPETYSLSFDGYNDFVEAEFKELYLVPGQEYTQKASILLPCDKYGTFEIPVIAASAKNSIEDEETMTLHVENQYDHSINLQTEAQLCSRVSQELDLLVTNEIGVPDEFNIILDGPGFIDTEERSFTLEGNRTQLIPLTAKPQEGDEGEYTLTVTVESIKGGAEKSRELKLDVDNCYDFTIGMGEPGAEGDKACCGSKEYWLNVRSLGDTEETYNVEIDGPSWFAAEEITVRLRSGENKNVRILADLPCVDDTFEIPVSVYNTRFPEVRETFTFTVETLTQRTCHQVNINDDEFFITKRSESVPVIVSHNGTEGGLYTISLDSELFTLVEDELLINAGERKVIHLKPVENVSSLDFGRYISKPTFTFSTPDEEIDYVEHLGTKLMDKWFGAKAWDWFKSRAWGAPGLCGWAGVFLFFLILLAIILLVFVAMRRFTWDPGLAILVRIILLALIIMVFILLAMVKIPAMDNFFEQPEDDYFITIEQNGLSTVELTQYFGDPDMNVLSYTATQPKDVAAYIDGSELQLRPDKGFAGVNQIVVSAHDNEGGIADSPILDIYVMAHKDLNFMDYWRLYCVQINLGLLLLLLLVLLIISFMIDDTHEETPIVILPPTTPRKRTVKKAPRKVAVVKRTAPKKKVATPQIVKTVPKATRKMSAAERAARSKALDKALVSSEEHEMKQVLATHKKRQTAENVRKLRLALMAFKRRKDYRPKNRESFYRYLKEQKVLAKLQGMPRPKKVAVVAKRVVKKVVKKTPKKVVVPKTARKMSAAEKAKRKMALDKALVSAEPHEMRQVLSTHGKKGTARNIEILQQTLKEFKASQYKTKNRETFYRYLKEKDILRRLHNK